MSLATGNAQSRVGSSRAAIAGGLLVLAFGVTMVLQVSAQVWNRDATLAKARASDRYTVTRVTPARRGQLFDRNGVPLATNGRHYSLVLNQRKVPVSEAFFLDVAYATGISAAELRKAVASAGDRGGAASWVLDPSVVKPEVVNAIKARWSADGMSFEPIRDRTYGLGEAMACLVGETREVRPDPDNLIQARAQGKPIVPAGLVAAVYQVNAFWGASFRWVGPQFRAAVAIDPETETIRNLSIRTGLEATLNGTLDGESGRQSGFRDRDDQVIPFRRGYSEDRPVRHGTDVTLTIDSRIQRAAYEAVRAQVKWSGATDGAAIVIDPRSGEILAMANYPSFRPGVVGPHRGDNPNGHNPAFMSQFEPGSTFKILTEAVARDEGVIGSNSAFFCRNSTRVRGHEINCDHGPHGRVTPDQAIAMSCNLAAMHWAQQVGRPRMMKFLEEIGIFRPSGLKLPKETTGYFFRRDAAPDLQNSLWGFGQAMSWTPLGVARAYAMLGNDGRMMPLNLYRQIGEERVNHGGGKQLLKPETARAVVESMKAVFRADMGGTAKTLNIPGYTLAGKTGTAEKVGRRGPEGYVSNFVGLVPADQPRALVMVMINEPKKGRHYGSQAAGPAFRRIAESVLRVYEVPPTGSVAQTAGGRQG